MKAEIYRGLSADAWCWEQFWESCVVLERYNKYNRKVAVFIDGENISHTKADSIIRNAKYQGKIISIRVYSMYYNSGAKKWKKVAKNQSIKTVFLGGPNTRNKVDMRICGEILSWCGIKNRVDVIVLVTSDNDYIKTVQKARRRGKRVVVMGTKCLSDKMKDACDAYFYL